MDDDLNALHDINIPIIYSLRAMHTNNTVKDHRINDDDLKKVKSYLDISDLILSLYREDFYNLYSNETNMAEIIRHTNNKRERKNTKIKYKKCKWCISFNEE